MSWTAERVALLRKLWPQGLSASLIADVLGDISRNSVIGKVHRLKLKARRTIETKPTFDPFGNPRRRKHKTKSPTEVEMNLSKERVKEFFAKPVPVETVQPVEIVPADSPGIPFLEARNGLCRWPLWPDHGRVPFSDKRFCGCPVRWTNGKRNPEAWCEEHYTTSVYPNHWRRAA